MAMAIRDNKVLGAVIRQERLKQDMRQVDLARKASVRQALISELENGAVSAKLDTVIKVLAALELDLSVIPRSKAEFDPAAY